MGITREKAEKHLAHLAKRREQYAERKAFARTPREPVQLVLFAKPVPRKPTPAELEAMEQDAKNIGRVWIRKIRAQMEEA